MASNSISETWESPAFETSDENLLKTYPSSVEMDPYWAFDTQTKVYKPLPWPRNGRKGPSRDEMILAYRIVKQYAETVQLASSSECQIRLLPAPRSQQCTPPIDLSPDAATQNALVLPTPLLGDSLTVAAASEVPSTSKTMSEALPTPTDFNQLPPELQMMIWDTCLRPRIASIQQKPRDGLTHGLLDLFTKCVLFSPKQPFPAVPLVSKQAKSVAVNHHKTRTMTFGAFLAYPILFNSSKDTLFFRNSLSLEQFIEEVNTEVPNGSNLLSSEAVKRLAATKSAANLLRRAVFSFFNLEILYVVDPTYVGSVAVTAIVDFKAIIQAPLRPGEVLGNTGWNGEPYPPITSCRIPEVRCITREALEKLYQ